MRSHDAVVKVDHAAVEPPLVDESGLEVVPNV
jgi:hypothetical protein